MLVSWMGPPEGHIYPLRTGSPQICGALVTLFLGSWKPGCRSGASSCETIIQRPPFPSRPQLRPRPPLSWDQPDDPPAVG